MNKKNISFPKKLSLKRILLLLFLLYLAALTVPYIPHKKVSDSFRKSFSERTFYSDTIGTERVAYIDDNEEALLYRLRMIGEADKEIILSTFDFNSDRAGKEILAALLHAADRGVSVRIIADGISGFLDLRGDPWFQAAASHENIEIRVYNPVNFLKPWDMQARLHDKYLIIDRDMYLLGGRNTANLFLGDYSSSKNIDRELFVYETQDSADSSLYELLDYFEHIWNLEESHDYTCRKKTDKINDCLLELEKQYASLRDQYPEMTEEWNWESMTMETNKVSLLYNPVQSENKEPWMWYSLHQLMMESNEVTIYTPYIICGKEMYDDLSALGEKDIPVEIITNDVASGANPWGCTDYLNQKKNIWETGVKVYEFMGSHSCHTKAVLIDDRMSIIGSYNLDMRSTYQDTELMLAVDSPELNALVRKEAETDKTYSKVMENGTYSYGENYESKELSLPKKIFYAVLRVVTVPIRRFL